MAVLSFYKNVSFFIACMLFLMQAVFIVPVGAPDSVESLVTQQYKLHTITYIIFTTLYNWEKNPQHFYLAKDVTSERLIG